jgi:mannose-6-phosphate isomerase-like protein (cupin superfamily)
MSTLTPFLVEPPAERPTPWRVVVDGERIGGITLGDTVMPPRTPGPARHLHTREDEGLYVLDGVLTAEVGEQRFEVGPGAFLWMPRGLPHTFANLGDEPVRGIGLINPSGLERFFAEMAEYVAATGGNPDPAVILQMNERYGVYPAEGAPLL